MSADHAELRWFEFIRRLRRYPARRWIMFAIAVMIALTSWLDYASGPGREPADLYDIPILVSAVGLGASGAVVTATFCGLAYLLTLKFQDVPYYYADVTQLLIFYFLGFLAARLVREYLHGCEIQAQLRALNAQLAQRISEALAAERLAQQKLRDGLRLTMLGEATAQIAHEIKNPLVSIGGFANRIQKQIDPDHPSQQGLSIIVREVTRIETMLKEMLDFVSPGCRERLRVEMAALVGDVLALAQPPAQERGVHLVTSFAGGPLSLLGDGEQLKRALLNVVLNGIQAMPEGGSLTVTTSAVVEQGVQTINVMVQDTGHGIPPGDLGRIFEPFFTTRHGGTGLGLALAKKTIEAHGGVLQIASTSRSGTAVKLSLPVQGPDPADSSSSCLRYK